MIPHLPPQHHQPHPRLSTLRQLLLNLLQPRSQLLLLP
jgi:hypothetical protein